MKSLIILRFNRCLMSLGILSRLLWSELPRLLEAIKTERAILRGAIIKGQCSSHGHENIVDGITKKAAENLQIINVAAGSQEWLHLSCFQFHTELKLFLTFYCLHRLSLSLLISCNLINISVSGFL